MRILLSNHHLTDYTGSEIFIFTIAKFLKKRGHEVIVYSKFVDKMLTFFDQEDIPVIYNLETIRNTKFDIACISHNINACEVRYYFPTLPIIYLPQGVIPILEQPPIINLNISMFVAISNSVKNNLIKRGVSQSKIKIFRNLIDEKLFVQKNEINKSPKKVLIISNHNNKQIEAIIKSAVSILKIKYLFIGQGHKIIKPNQLPELINKTDLVITLGRGAIEAMMCGRIPIIYDHRGGDGVVTSDNFQTIMANNFSGSLYRHKYTAKELVAQIKKYKKEEGIKLRELAIKYYGANKNIGKLIDIFRKYKNIKVRPLTIDENYRLKIFIEQIKETKKYSENKLLIKNQLQQLDLLNKVKMSKFYKFWRFYCNIRDKIFYVFNSKN